MEFRPMSPAEVERTVQFLLHHEAQFAADFARLSAKTDRMAEGIVGLTTLVDRVDRKVEQLAGSMDAMRDGLVALTGIVGRTSERVDRLVEAQRRTDEQINRTDEQIKRTDEQIKRTDRQIKRTDERIKGTDQQIKDLGTYFKRHLRQDHGRVPRKKGAGK